jgi:Zn-dependent peptidase ImmA (M78 family)
MTNPSEEIIFEPSILKWAREKRFGPQIDVVAAKLSDSSGGISLELIKDWEGGSAQPTLAQVKTLAEFYKRPLAVFFLDSPPEESSNPPDLRTIGSKDNKVLSPEALLVIRKARRIQEVSHDLYEELGEKPTFKYSKHTSTEDPVKLADKVRSDLSVSIDDQFKFKKYEDFFEYLRAKIEDTGVITLKSGLHDSFPEEDCRAFSFVDKQPFLILVNNKDTEGAKNFSLPHEFAHILLREAGICNNFKSFSNINKLEVFCNNFAASFLVPEEHFLGHKILRDKIKIREEELDVVVKKLATDFKVSRVVILRRLRTFKFIDPATYDEKIKIWGEEPVFRRKGGGTFSLKTPLLKNGRAYSSLVFEAYRQKKLSYSRVSDYLGLKIKHLPAFEKLLNSHG